MVNVGGDVDGAQIGVVNVARKVRGLQLGVVNVGESVSGASVGVLSIIGDGYHDLALWGSDHAAHQPGLKLGSQHVYTLLGGGIGRSDATTTGPCYGLHAGLGVHVTPGDQPPSSWTSTRVTTQFATSDDWSEDSARSPRRA